MPLFPNYGSTYTPSSQVGQSQQQGSGMIMDNPLYATPQAAAPSGNARMRDSYTTSTGQTGSYTTDMGGSSSTPSTAYNPSSLGGPVKPSNGNPLAVNFAPAAGTPMASPTPGGVNGLQVAWPNPNQPVQSLLNQATATFQGGNVVDPEVAQTNQQAPWQSQAVMAGLNANQLSSINPYAMQAAFNQSSQNFANAWANPDYQGGYTSNVGSTYTPGSYNATGVQVVPDPNNPVQGASGQSPANTQNLTQANYQGWMQGAYNNYIQGMNQNHLF